MRKSKLESYEDTLEALVNKPLTADQIAYEINVNCTILKQRLDFLIKNSLIEERGLGKTMLYAITERGIAVLKTLHFPKYLGKITDKITVIDETLQIIREFEKKNRKKKYDK
jgi:predicted transcriptional regulator